MNAISEEQTIVLNNTKSGHNSVVDAVAGSGKSTTILSIASKMISKKFIQFTYNSMLRQFFIVSHSRHCMIYNL